MKASQLYVLFQHVLVLLFAILTFLQCFVESACDEADRDSLLSFYHNVMSFSSSSSSSSLNWSSSTDCCHWHGIRCEVVFNGDHRVTHLQLPSTGLYGAFFPNFTNLPHLTHLNLSRNSLSGALPPEFFSSFNNLKVLDLSYNRFHGRLSSSSVSDNSVFQTVDLSSNVFEGELPSSLFSLSVASGSLNSFNVSNNSFLGQIPISDFCSVTVSGNSSQLRFLDFSFNDFTGVIPREIGGCSKLKAFHAGFNNLSGPIPDELYEVRTLEQISLSVNRLYGPIGDGVVRLSKLRILELFSNQLNGSIPEDIGKLTSLEKLLLHINNFTGLMPYSLMNCTNLSTLNLRVNSLVGNLSGYDFSALQRLATLDLGNNNFTGEIPSSLYSCKFLTAVRLAANRLTGQVLPQIRNLESLSFLSISNNSLSNITGALKNLENNKNLTSLLLSKNFMNEAMPEDENIVGPDGFQNLQVFGIGGCLLSGRVPTWLAKLQKLQVLDLSINLLSGPIPGRLGRLPSLFYLDLSNNLISGGFPKEICGLPALTSGLSDLVNSSYLELPVFAMPNNATNQQYNQLSNLPPAIYLSNNNRNGNIPVEIGQLKCLHVLELNNNRFYGSIPDQISNLTNLERLDLSRNHLSGGIPSSLKGLHFLSYFSVAYNDLQGPVPSGGQFDTFSSSSFDGNSGLCGPPAVQRSCSQPEAPTHVTHRRRSNKNVVKLIVGVYLGTGFIVTMVALCILSRNTNRTNLNRVSSNSNHSTLSTNVDTNTGVVTFFPNNGSEIKNLTISEILIATENFSEANIIGCGSFSLVYKATLANGSKLAIKKLLGDFGPRESDLKATAEALSKCQHENLVSLQGYCVYNNFWLLIYPYMENGSLDFWLHEKANGASQLDWPTRLEIAKGASCGLAYIQQPATKRQTIHANVKSSKILLNEKFESRLSDFGLSQLVLANESGELATEHFSSSISDIPSNEMHSIVATLREDVYSFGVVILELLTRKRSVEVFEPKMSRELVSWVQQMKNQGKEEQVFDPLLRGKGFEDEMLQVLDLACMCTHQNVLMRPTIREVVERLKNVGKMSQYRYEYY